MNQIWKRKVKNKKHQKQSKHTLDHSLKTHIVTNKKSDLASIVKDVTTYRNKIKQEFVFKDYKKKS